MAQPRVAAAADLCSWRHALRSSVLPRSVCRSDLIFSGTVDEDRSLADRMDQIRVETPKDTDRSVTSKGRYASAKESLSLSASVKTLLDDKDSWTLSLADGPSEPRVGRCPPTRNAVDIYNYTKEDLKSQIDALTNTPSLEMWKAEDAMKKAGISRAKWRKERQQSSARKAGAAFQKSMTSFSLFLDNFSGLAEIAKFVDRQYGGLAYGTLSLMLSVFEHKTSREEALDEGFEELALACPRLQTLQTLRQEGVDHDHHSFERLHPLVLSTCGLVVVFAREVTEYYISRARRVKEIFVPEQKKNKTLSEIRKTLGEVRQECDLLVLVTITALQRKLYDMSASLEEARAHAIETSSQGRRARKSSDTSKLAKLRQILGVQEPCEHVDLAEYKALLVDTFFSGSVRYKHCEPRQVSMELLKEDGDFHDWWESPKSCLLLAGGSNFVDDHCQVGVLNWLSYGAVLTIEELRRQRQDVAFVFAQTSLALVPQKKRCSIQNIMANLIYQIAGMHDDLLRGKIDKLRAAVQTSAWHKNNTDAFMSEIGPLLLDVFTAFPERKQIFMVIDRLDQCFWEADEDADMRTAIEGLLCVVAETSCHLKILLTVDSAALQKLARTKAVFHKKERKALLLKPEWCQATGDS